MTPEKIYDIVQNVQDKPNKDLSTCLNLLTEEFEKTKELIVDLTKHMETIEEMYNIVNNELGKRVMKL
jgi:ribosome-associated toxin RatA of RatAB toxin-antitoxin module